MQVCTTHDKRNVDAFPELITLVMLMLTMNKSRNNGLLDNTTTAATHTHTKIIYYVHNTCPSFYHTCFADMRGYVFHSIHFQQVYVTHS